jgi:hypothetical protein
MDEEVYYCNSCLSLHIVIRGEDDVCGNCGAVNYVSVVPFDKYLEIREESTNIKS